MFNMRSDVLRWVSGCEGFRVLNVSALCYAVLRCPGLRWAALCCAVPRWAALGRGSRC